MTCSSTSLSARAPRLRGFTLVELLLVLFLIILLTAMAVPSFAQLTRTSKLDQATKAVFSALKQARTAALNMRRVTAVLYGDDFSGITPGPVSGVLPAKGEIEIWTMLDGGHHEIPYQPDIVSGPGYPAEWYPYRFPDIPVTPSPITFPDGVRVISGEFDTTALNFHFGTKYKKDARGEVIRHQTVFAHDGGKPAWHSSACSTVLVFEQLSGAHCVILTGADWNAYLRPRVISTGIKKVGGVVLTNPAQINQKINEYPGTYTGP
jgi:type II secretory pathway pseudopilin PulG